MYVGTYRCRFLVIKTTQIHEVIEDAKKACPHIPVIFVIVVPSPDCGEAMCKSIEKEMRTSYGKDNFVSKKMSFNQLM